MRHSDISLKEIFAETDLNEGGFGEEELEDQEYESWEQEGPPVGVSRSSPTYVRWVQESLNRILGLNLKADGIMGPQTRSALRSFQQDQSLKTDGIVGPTTEAALKRALNVTPVSQSTGEFPRGPFGVLTVSAPGRFSLSYIFTPEDVLWTARFIVGEAGGKDNAENRAVIWAMLNRYAFFTHKYYKTFGSFLRAYSTPLQPVLRSWGAARRHMHKPEFIKTGGFYAPPHDNIPRGQLRQFLNLQSSPWNQLPQSARSLALKAAKGLAANPIGNASEFGSTYVYFYDKYRRKPTDEEWRRYTEAYAHQKGWIWIGEVPNLSQRGNAFFVQRPVAHLPPNTVRIISA